jgi:hypothetical protein
MHMSGFAYIPIIIAGVSAIIAALMNTEVDPHSLKRKTVFRRPTAAGWFLIVLTVLSTAAAIVIANSDDRDKQRAEDRSKAIKAELEDAKQSLTSQQELIQASLLGQETERPQATLILGTTYKLSGSQRAWFESANVDGGAIAKLALGDLFDRTTDSVVADVQARFADLKPVVRNPREETVETEWPVWLQTTKSHKSHVVFSGAGPDERIAPDPVFQLRVRENQLALLLHSALTKPVSSAVLFRGPDTGLEVASIRFRTNGLDQPSVTALATRVKTLFLDGEEWTLINSPSGLCALTTLRKATVQEHTDSAAITVAWRVKRSNRLVLCPQDLFFVEQDTRRTP